MTNERNERKERMIRLNEFKSNDGKKTETREKNRQNRADIRDDEVARIFSNVMCESWSYKKKIVVCVCVWQNHCRIQLKWTEFATKITNMAQAKPTDYDNIIISF